MIIAISQRNMKIGKGANSDVLENDYIKYYESFGLILLPIPNVCKDISSYFKQIPIEGIILTGGGDVNPSYYHQKSLNGEYSVQRDSTERKLIQIALKMKLPLLSNCRGAQFINVFFGGSLIQNIKKKTGFNHVNSIHKVNIIDKKAMEFYRKKEFIVNSYHNDGIDQNCLSKKLKPFAVSEDGIIEAIYHPNYPMVGILWHPERNGSDKDADNKLIKAFVKRKFFWVK